MSKAQSGSARRLFGFIAGAVCLVALVRIGVFIWPIVHQPPQTTAPQPVTGVRRTLPPEYLALAATAPRMSGKYPCIYQSMTEGSSSPQLGDCGMLTLSPVPVDRFEADLRFGNFVVRQTDLFLNDQFVVPFTRAYNSDDWFHPNHVHAFGRNTNHPYDIAPVGARNPYSWQAIALEDGNFVYMDRISDGASYADAVFRHTETSSRFYNAITYWNGDGWTTRLADGSMILFPESYRATKIADGAAYEIDDASGNKLLLQRDPQHNLQSIRTPHGHTISLVCDDQGRIIRARDDAGSQVSYEYGLGSTLVAVRASSGKERYYEYEDQRITAVRDEHQRLLLQNTYDQGKLVVQQFANGQIYRYAYRWSADGTYVENAVITFPDGSEQIVATGEYVPDYIKRRPL
jgi:YD repeat-containing protein